MPDAASVTFRLQLGRKSLQVTCAWLFVRRWEPTGTRGGIKTGAGAQAQQRRALGRHPAPPTSHLTRFTISRPFASVKNSLPLSKSLAYCTRRGVRRQGRLVVGCGGRTWQHCAFTAAPPPLLPLAPPRGPGRPRRGWGPRSTPARRAAARGTAYLRGEREGRKAGGHPGRRVRSAR